MTRSEKLHAALLLAGLRAMVEGRPIVVSESTEGGFLLNTSNPRDIGWLRVSPAGNIFSHAGRSDRGGTLSGRVTALLSTHTIPPI